MIVITKVLEGECLFQDKRLSPTPWVDCFVGQVMVRVIVKPYWVVFESSVVLPFNSWFLCALLLKIRLVHVFVQLVALFMWVLILLFKTVVLTHFLARGHSHCVLVTLLFVTIFKCWVKSFLVYFFNLRFYFQLCWVINIFSIIILFFLKSCASIDF